MRAVGNVGGKIAIIGTHGVGKTVLTFGVASELRKGNIAAAIFIASIFVGIALIIGGALN